jgi:hypothetical protein
MELPLVKAVAILHSPALITTAAFGIGFLLGLLTAELVRGFC